MGDVGAAPFPAPTLRHTDFSPGCPQGRGFSLRRPLRQYTRPLSDRQSDPRPMLDGLAQTAHAPWRVCCRRKAGDSPRRLTRLAHVA
jgi:hypothetical protein